MTLVWDLILPSPVNSLLESIITDADVPAKMPGACKDVDVTIRGKIAGFEVDAIGTALDALPEAVVVMEADAGMHFWNGWRVIFILIEF
jgi:hypothetical protein